MNGPSLLKSFLIRGRTQITLAVEGGGGVVKCLCYYISLCSKLANKGGGGVKNLQNPANVICVRPLTIKTLMNKSQQAIEIHKNWKQGWKSWKMLKIINFGQIGSRTKFSGKYLHRETLHIMYSPNINFKNSRTAHPKSGFWCLGRVQNLKDISF